LVWLNQETGGC